MRPKKVEQSPMQRMNEACCKAAELMLEEMETLRKAEDSRMPEHHRAAAMARLGAAIAQLKIGAEPPDWAALMKAGISSGFGASALLDRSDAQ